MPHWYEPILTFLAAQPAATGSVTLPFAEVAALAGELPSARARTRAFWWDRRPHSIGAGLAVCGWRVAHGLGRPPAITFERLPPETSA